MELYATGVFTVFELRCAHQYINIDDPEKPKVELAKWTTVVLWISGIFGLFVALYFVALISIVATNGDITKAIIGVVSLVVMGIFSVGMFLTEARDILVSKGVRKKLNKIYASD